jgi:dipeptidase E
MGKIVAIGGGEMGRPREDGSGNYPVETTPIDMEIIKLTGKPNPKLLFIPTASNDSIDYFQIVKKHFLSLGCSEVNALYLSDKSLTNSLIRQRISSHDAIYVGGGNTLRMINVWRKKGVDKLLQEAYEHNVVLSGLSAGSICWFSNGGSDSRKFSSDSDKLIKVTGLGFIDAVHCPHYDSEPFRQRGLKRILKSTSKVAIALDNCSALEVVDDKYRIIASKPTAKARKIYWKHGEYIIQEIAVDDKFRPLQELIKK